MSVSFKHTNDHIANSDIHAEVPEKDHRSHLYDNVTETDFGTEVITRHSRAEYEKYSDKKRVYRESSADSYHSDTKSSTRRSVAGKTPYTLTATEIKAAKANKMKDGPSSTSTVLIALGLIFSGFMLTTSGIIILTTEFDERFILVAWIFIISGLLMIFGSLLGKMKNVKKLLSKKYWNDINNFKGREPTTMFDWG